MRYAKILVIAAFLLPSAASAAGPVSQEMTCAQAVEHYEKFRQIMTINEGQELPIDQGTPIRQAETLNCTSDQENRFETMVPTKDNPQCVIAAYCG
jgi:hypothetical protein